MKTINIPYTSLKEQEKIGNFIKKLDLQLTKQQEKIQKLQNIKQSLLEKMFI
jgi:restriction modification system DNA specificity domain protein